VYNSHRNRLRDAVARARPGAVLIPAFAETPRTGGGTLPAPMVLVVLDRHVECWTGAEQPASTMALTGATIRVARVWTGARSYAGIQIAHGSNMVAFVPHYSTFLSASDLE